VLRPAGFDSLAADNEAWVTLPSLRPLDVFVAESLPVFRHALGALDGIRIFPAKDVPLPGAFDLAISDKAATEKARLLCTVGIVPQELASLVSIGSKTASAIDWRRESPLLQHVSFDEVIFMEDPTFAAGRDEAALANQGYEILAQGPHGPLMLLHGGDADAGGSMRVHLLFHPDRSTLPFRVAFPILVTNLVQQAQKLAGLSESTAVAAGVLPPQSFEPGAVVSVRGPGKSVRTERADERGMAGGIPAPRVGEYKLSVGETTQTIGASLLSSLETSLAAVNELEFGDRISVAAASAAPKADRSLWWMLAMAGFVVLLVEWWWFQRRTAA
jgi:hypothetical protein